MYNAECYEPVKYSFGKIVELFIYESEKQKTFNKTLVIGTVSQTSEFSVILAFSQIPSTDGRMYFAYSGRITATVLGTPSFYLDSFTIFCKFLVFTNKDSLFVTDLEKFIEGPNYLTPMQIKRVSLDTLIASYSEGLYPKTECIASIQILDR